MAEVEGVNCQVLYVTLEIWAIYIIQVKRELHAFDFILSKKKLFFLQLKDYGSNPDLVAESVVENLSFT